MPEATVLYRVVQQHFGEFLAQLEAGDRRLPAFVTAEFEAHLDCGLLSRGCLHVRCEQCGDEMVVAFSCRGRFCPSCGGRRMTELAAHRALARKYPGKKPAELLADLVAATPGDEGKWFATAKDVGLLDEAIRLANHAPCDPKTLTRAVRDFADARPSSRSRRDWPRSDGSPWATGTRSPAPTCGTPIGTR